MTALALCGHACPIICPAFEPCPREAGHDDEHVYWSQSALPGEKRKKNGVWVINGAGAALLHADFQGYIQAEEIGALLALRDFVHAQRAEPDSPAPPVGPGFIPPPKGTP